MAKKQRDKTYHHRPSAAWEATKNYYEFNGIRDSQTGWTKRLGLSKTAFANRIRRYKAGDISFEEVFRKAHTPSHLKPVQTSRTHEELKALRKVVALKYWAAHPRKPPYHNIHIWESVYYALAKIKPRMTEWSRFFIERFKLPVDPDTGKPIKS